MDGHRFGRRLMSLFLYGTVVTQASGVASQAFIPAAVTARAQVPRALSSTFGWYSTSESDGLTTYAPVDYLPQSFAGYWYDGELLTSCGGGIVEGPETTRTCDSTAGKCLTEALLSTYGATVPIMRKVTCIGLDWVTKTYYKEKPLSSYASTQPPIDWLATTESNPSTTSSSSLPLTLTSTPTPTVVSQTTTPPPSSTPDTNNSGGGNNNAGIIAGSVIGGIAIIGAFVLAGIWLMRRNRNRDRAPYESPAPAMNGDMEYYKATHWPQGTQGSTLAQGTGELYGDNRFPEELEGRERR